MKYRLNGPASKYIGFILAISLLGSSTAAAQQPNEAQKAIDRYFEVAGGRDVWANAAGEYVLAVTKDPRFPLPYTFEFCWSFKSPRTAERARFQNRTQLRGFDKGNGWSFRRDAGNPVAVVKPWTATQNDENFGVWRGAFEVVLHRLAARDPALSVRMGTGPWTSYVEIVESGAPIGRLLLNSNGEPLRYQRPSDDTRVVFGPLADRGAFKFPSGGSFEIGATFEIIALELKSAEPTDVFGSPQPSHKGDLNCR